jgi:hypothetical protein
MAVGVDDGRPRRWDHALCEMRPADAPNHQEAQQVRPVSAPNQRDLVIQSLIRRPDSPGRRGA